MPDFDASYQRDVAGPHSEEGAGMENVVGDRGGRTFMGISEVFNSTWPGWALIDSGVALTDPTLLAQVRSFYLANYWQACRCDLLPDPLAGAVFSAAINCGPVEVIKWLQQALNLAQDLELAVDGIMGQKTLSAIGQERSEDLEAQFLGFWLKHYIDDCLSNPTQRKFFKGWVRRASSYFAA